MPSTVRSGVVAARVIGLSFGGGASLSWLRLAVSERLSFRGGLGGRGVALTDGGPWLAGESSESVLACFEPENTVLLLCLLPLNSAFRLSISCCIQALDPSASSSLSKVGDAVCNGCSFVVLRASFLFFCASCCAHCLFNLFKSASALASSSFNSNTLRSCVAIAVKKFVSIGPVGDASDSGTTASAISRTGDCAERMGLVDPLGCTGNDTENRFERVAWSVTEDMVDIVLLWLWKLALAGELAECAGLLGEATCSTGLGFAANTFDPVRISPISIGSIFLLFREDIIVH